MSSAVLAVQALIWPPRATTRVTYSGSSRSSRRSTPAATAPDGRCPSATAPRSSRSAGSVPGPGSRAAIRSNAAGLKESRRTGEPGTVQPYGSSMRGRRSSRSSPRGLGCLVSIASSTGTPRARASRTMISSSSSVISRRWSALAAGSHPRAEVQLGAARPASARMAGPAPSEVRSSGQVVQADDLVVGAELDVALQQQAGSGSARPRRWRRRTRRRSPRVAGRRTRGGRRSGDRAHGQASHFR